MRRVLELVFMLGLFSFIVEQVGREWGGGVRVYAAELPLPPCGMG